MALRCVVFASVCMLHPPSLLLSLSLLTGILAAGSPPSAQDQTYRQDVFALCGEAMAGRGVGKDGGEQAIRYIAARLEALGLRPAANGSLRLDFGVDDPVSGYLPSTAATLAIAERRSAWIAGQHFVPFRCSRDGDVDAAVVFAGHGLVIATAQIDDYAGLDVRGKVVLLLRGGPDWRSPECGVDRSALTFVAKAAVARQHGAAALLLVDRLDPGFAEGEPKLALRVGGDGGLPMLWARRAAVAPLFVDGEAGLSAAQRRLDAGAAVPAAALRPGARIALHVAMPPKLQTANVVGLWPGNDRELAGEFVVIGAHHDHLGRGEFASLATGEEEGRVHPGADDNASGVAGLLELARRLVARGPQRRSLVFAAFGAEEFGQLGSREFLSRGPIRTGSIVAMVDLDMIGRARSGTPMCFGVDSGIGIRQLLLQQARGLQLRPILRNGESPRSDCDAFLAQGIPAVLFTTGLHAQYHRPADVPELIECEPALRWLDLSEALVRELANGRRVQFAAAVDRREHR